MSADHTIIQPVHACPELDEASRASQLRDVETLLAELTEIFADRLVGVFDVEDELATPPAAVVDIMARLIKNDELLQNTDYLPYDNRRATARLTCPKSAIAVPVDREFVPVGDPFCAAIRDISEGGIRLLHTRNTNARFLALSWRAETLPCMHFQLPCHVKRCEPMSLYYNIAAEFVLAD